jgi:hypothetical protein
MSGLLALLEGELLLLLRFEFIAISFLGVEPGRPQAELIFPFLYGIPAWVAVLIFMALYALGMKGLGERVSVCAVRDPIWPIHGVLELISPFVCRCIGRIGVHNACHIELATVANPLRGVLLLLG